MPVTLSSEALAPIVTLESGGASPPLHAARQQAGPPIDFETGLGEYRNSP
jgi:hypothetical protein